MIHDTTAYDRKEGKLERSRAYTYALEGVQGILQEHPTIEVILDLHRDGVSDSLPGWYRKFRGNPRQRSCSFRE